MASDDSFDLSVEVASVRCWDAHSSIAPRGEATEAGFDLRHGCLVVAALWNIEVQVIGHGSHVSSIQVMLPHEAKYRTSSCVEIPMEENGQQATIFTWFRQGATPVSQGRRWMFELGPSAAC